MKTQKPRKRTDKVFEDYNDYRDRPFGLKWSTAFAIDELNKVITDNKLNDRKEVKLLNQMSREEIDDILQIAFLKTKKVSIQINKIGKNGNTVESIEGYFKGYADYEYLYIDNNCIEWDLIRNIKLLK